MRAVQRIPGVLVVVLALGCAADTPSSVQAPGRPKSGKHRMLETGADLLQRKTPLSAIDLYLDGFHFYADELGRQVESHHYCSMLNDEVHQCVIYDGNTEDAKLIGVEYIISERLFRELPAEEKRLWHSHRFEVRSGALIAPGLPEKAEHEVLEHLASTYGKTWHLWQVDRRDALPLGIPRLMMGFTGDGQLRPELLAERDRRMGVSSSDKRRDRATIRVPEPVPGADVWESGQTPQIDLRSVPVRPTR